MKIKDVMTSEPVVVAPNAAVRDIIELLARHRISGVFVTDQAGSPVGVVTEADLVRRLAPGGEEAPMAWLARWFSDTDRAASL